MSTGEIPVSRGKCPPPIKTANPDCISQIPTDKPICIGHIVNALVDIEVWIRSVRETLECFDQKQCVNPCDTFTKPGEQYEHFATESDTAVE